MSSTGFVNQAFRNMVNWKWYHDYPVNILFHHLLHIANVDDIVINGLCVKAGSILTTIPCLSFATGLTEKQIRTACEKLISSNDISINSFHKKGSIITVTEWDKYVLDNSDNSKLNKSINFDEGRKTADKGQIQSVDDNHVTTPAETKTADKGQINDENDANGGKRADKRADKLESQHVELQNNANETICDGADKRADIGQKGQQPKEPENKESSPTPLKENKEEEKENPFEKEEKIKEEKSSTAISEQDTKKTRRKPVYTVTYSIETGTFSGITENDKEMWHKTYPNIDIDNEIMKAACWLYSNYDKNKSNYKSFLNKWFNKAQRDAESQHAFIPFPEQHPFVTLPNTVDDVMAKIQEQKLAMSREEAEKFFHHYKALGWKKNGNTVYDWTELVRLWQANIAKFERNGGTQQLLPLEETPLEKALREFNDE